MATKPKIAILTFCVGADYKRAMEPGLASKRLYAAKHGYDLHIGGEDVWDRSRPIPWSKFHFINKYLDDYDYLFWSDADAIILNQEITLETHIFPLLPAEKDILWTYDACNHFNNGHLFIRGKSAWVRDFFRRAYAQTNLIHHIWWDNAAMIALFESNPEDRAHIETCKEHWKFNSYVFGPNNSAKDSVRLYERGDFLIHFAGVYEPLNIHRMMRYAQQQYARCAPLDKGLLDEWRKNPPAKKQEVDEFFKHMEFDIVIPCVEKDVDSLKRALAYTRKNVIGYRHIYVITNDITSVEGCIIIPESLFPFTKETITSKHDTNLRTGWYFQQLLKLYSGTYIPGITDRYLALDSDIFFLKPTRFISDDNKALFCVGNEYHPPYFRHMARLHPSLIRVDELKSGIVHHMMFDKKCVNTLFQMVEHHHGGKHTFWELFITHIDITDESWRYKGTTMNSGSSEYELYLNYMLAFHREKITIRELKMGNEANWDKSTGHEPIDTDKCLMTHETEGYDCVAIHNYV